MIAVLLRHRLHWYAISTGRLVLRRWQALLLAIAVLAPAGMPVLMQARSLGWPLLALLSPEHGVPWRYACLCLYQALAAAWVLMQRDQVGGGDFMAYARSLPLPPRDARAVDVLVLLAANSPLFLMPAAALAWLFARESAMVALPHALFIGHVLVLCTLVQLACLDRAHARLGAIAIANVPLVLAPAAAPMVQLFLLGATLPCAWLATRYLSEPFFEPWLAAAQRHAAALASRMAPARLHPAAFISVQCLVRQSRAEALGKLAAAATITAASLWLMALWNYDGRSATLAVITLALVALALCGLYRDLHMAHRAALPLVAALPLRPHWARRFDHAAMMLASAPFAAVIAGVVAFYQPHRLVPMLLVGAAFLGLVAILRLPQVHADRQAVFFTAVLAGLWAGITAMTLV